MILFIISECFGAKERSRQRSGSTRSVPVAANIKREVNFDCPEEFGYYPHPTDCTLYYVCVFGGALMESCTGGLMYSHELQTCDWPRNVGCDATGTYVGEELDRLSERNPPPPPPPPPPRRTTQPHPSRAHPNPVITSRGQPKFNRQEYEQQQQLFAEVDELPPVEEFENDRQQRVYRGQPSTIGQVQKDRDGYSAQSITSGRTLNSNIIPASIPQTSGKFSSFSYGTQVDERRTATVTPAPQTYRADNDNVTDFSKDRDLDIMINHINPYDTNDKKNIRSKRDVDMTETNLTSADKKFDRTDSHEINDDVAFGTETTLDGGDDNEKVETDRDKRQVTYLLKSGKNWQNSRPVKFIDLQQFPQYKTNIQNTAIQNTFKKDNFTPVSRKPYSLDSYLFSTANPFLSYQTEGSQSQRPFRPSLHDPIHQKYTHSSLNTATQIVTKSPPISSINNKENLISSLSGGFYNNAPKDNQQLSAYTHSSSNQPKIHPVIDSSHVSSMVVTNKPIQLSSFSQSGYDHPLNHKQIKQNPKYTKDEQMNIRNNQNYRQDLSSKHEYYDDSYESNENDEIAEEDNDQYFKHNFPDPPYAFTHPNNKYAHIDNPFAKPNFDFDAFLTKLQNDHYSTLEITSPQPKNIYSSTYKTPIEITSSSYKTPVRQSTVLNYKGVSTPRPFTLPNIPTTTASFIPNSLFTTNNQTQKYQQFVIKPPFTEHHQKASLRENHFNKNIPLNKETGNILPKLKPPNFTDERQLPITYSFSRPVEMTRIPNLKVSKYSSNFPVTQKPYILVTSTGTPFITSTTDQHLKNIHSVSSIKPFTISAAHPTRPDIYNIHFEQSVPKSLTTVANEQLSTLQNYWKNLTNDKPIIPQSTFRPTTEPNTSQFDKLFTQATKFSTQTPYKTNNIYSNTPIGLGLTTTNTPLNRKPIPKPSPEMNDYYYDDEDDNYYYEPVVKPKYMPSSEVRPQRPPMAQNYREYEDNYSNIDEQLLKFKQTSPNLRRPIKPVTKNQNDISYLMTKTPFKESNKNLEEKFILSPPSTQNLNITKHPEIANYKINHNLVQNRTINIRKPIYSENGPHTVRPPKYLNQTTLRPYTVRHRLAKPTEGSKTVENKQNKGRIRHPNIVAQMLTTPRDNYNQETRYTKSKHDGKSNSLEPTESVTPSSFSPSPRPKMLYNGSQNYSPDQFDPFYAVYDEDGELYKDTDYVQQYNTASLRPVVQQTYRGTPPPTRRPVETYTPKPVVSDDYDDVLIQEQINNPNQYQTPVRHSTRGEGNELGYEHNPNNVRTTVYEATSFRTSPSTTSTTTTTTTTTQRSTTALFTEAMTPSRFTSRFSADENPGSSTQNSFTESTSVPSTLPPVINISSRAKPFRMTDNSHRLVDFLDSTEALPTHRLPTSVTNANNNTDMKIVGSNTTKNKLSVSTGFTIRRNANNTKNPYTLTVITRPYDGYNTSKKVITFENNNFNEQNTQRLYYNTNEDNAMKLSKTKVTVDNYNNESPLINRRGEIPSIQQNKTNEHHLIKTKYKNERHGLRINTTPATSASTKYYLKNIIKRPLPLSSTEEIGDITENVVRTSHFLTNMSGEDALLNDKKIYEPNGKEVTDNLQETIQVPLTSLNNSFEQKSYIDDFIQDYSMSSTTLHTTTLKQFYDQTTDEDKYASRKPSYYSYSVDDEIPPDHTTKVLRGKVKNVIKTFFNNLVSHSRATENIYVSTPKITSTTSETIVNIGYQKKKLKYVDDKPIRGNVKYLEIITEPSVSRFTTQSVDSISFTESFDSVQKGLPLETISTESFITTTPIIQIDLETSVKVTNSSESKQYQDINKNSLKSKFSNLLTSSVSVPVEKSHKYQNIIDDALINKNSDNLNISNIDVMNEFIKPTTAYEDEIVTMTEMDQHQPIPAIADVASTTSTTKSTTTVKLELKTTTKSLSFPTRASRVNPAIKLAAANLGGGRRSYQSSTNCSSDNSLQANPKCNEIKYQRPSSTRGRGSAHYSPLSGSEAPQQQQQSNRGTPPTRSRPTLKPSTAIVSENIKFVDIYANPPRRPAPVYPQPTPDKTAAKCRKDVCLLPDCYCGGKDIPGDLPVESVPQIVLLTFDDSVNDLNKVLYADLFEKGRVNPNGCPISATFYVSHEWTDYSQVQNLYASGHEMASHTISHSFGEQFSQKKWNREVGGQREILAAYGGVKLEDVRGMRAPFLSVGGNKMFKMLYDSNFTYDSSLPVYENRPPSWPYTLDYKLFHDCMIPPCPTKSYPGVWEVPMVMWQDLNGGRCSMGDACANPPEAEGVYKMLLKNFDRHYTTNRAPFGLFYHAAWFTQPHHKEGFIMFLDYINKMKDVWIVTNWQALQWVRDPTPISRLNNFQPFQCNYQDRPKKCNNPKVCNLWHKSGVRYMRTCQPCPEIYPWTGKTGIKSSRIDNEIEE
ncbi:unnamed protein product [Parnassius mnemosyne]|uniref:Chitin-binding type-2 domain-containing protein n=1 Tax=Parnassius mnemosyne TaxID=213953 RepID=A0AAV1M3H0_9NEOP